MAFMTAFTVASEDAILFAEPSGLRAGQNGYPEPALGMGSGYTDDDTQRPTNRARCEGEGELGFCLYKAGGKGGL
jgi:hypothetical protein